MRNQIEGGALQGLSRALGRVSLLAEQADLPTADEIGAEFERYLADRSRREEE